MWPRIFTSVCLVVSLVIQYAFADCPSPYRSRGQGEETICYLPAFNCGPDAEIKKTTENLGKDECVKCKPGYINSFIVSSVDTVEHRCFEKKNVHELCPLDTVPVENITNSGACLLYCTCAHYGCYHGTVPCECEGPRSPCEENRTMDPVTGDCIPCPENSYKLEPGCGPCTWYVTAILGDLSTEHDTDPKTDSGKPTFKPVAIPTDQPYSVNSTANSTDPDKESHNGKDDGFSPAPVIAIIVVLVVVAIMVALVLITRRKLQSNDNDSGLVRCYHTLCPVRRLEANASHRDTESVDALEPSHAPLTQNGERPLQQVAPMTKSNGSLSNTSEADHDCSTTPFADLSMSPGPRPVPQISVNDEEAPTSASPLIENRDSVDPELTVEKTAVY